MKFAEPRPYANPEAAARKIIEIANSVEAVQDGRIFIELINGPMLFEHKATPAEYGAGRDYAIAKGLHCYRGALDGRGCGGQLGTIPGTTSKQ
jgi:hypothetical protein